MVTVEMTSEGIIWASIKNVKTFDKKDGIELNKKLKDKLLEHDTITLDMFGVEELSESGYKELSDFFKQATACNCTIYCAQVHDKLSEIIDSFTKTTEG